MIGIKSYGAYIPLLRLSQAEIARAYDRGAGPGELAVANFDEDTITMGVEAGVDCMRGVDRSTIDGVFFACTTPPYREKQSAPVIAEALDLKRELITTDIGNSLRAGTTAMNLALAAVESGRANNVIVVSSEMRRGFPGSEYERLLGDGAASLLIGNSDVIAAFEGSYTISDEMIDNWRAEHDNFVKSWEDRFVLTQGYTRNVHEAVKGLLKKYNLKPKDITKAILYGPDARNHQAMAKELGFDLKTQVQDPMFGAIGNTGTAMTMMTLVAALETAKPGDLLLVASYGDGADAFLIRVTPEIEKARGHRGIKGHINSKRSNLTYNKYLRLRGLLAVEESRRPVEVSSPVMLLRDRETLLAFKGVKCKVCGRVQFPKQRVCYHCRSKDQFDEVRLSDKKATIFTFCVDHLAATGDPPTIKAIIDFEGGGRTLCHMADRNTDAVKIGSEVEMAFRKIHDAMGFHNYTWKPRLVRE
ncbi:MAG: hydroxymethylglutaryl-CoA synthase [Dehalococcoidia bacterium]